MFWPEYVMSVIAPLVCELRGEWAWAGLVAYCRNGLFTPTNTKVCLLDALFLYAKNTLFILNIT